MFGRWKLQQASVVCILLSLSTLAIFLPVIELDFTNYDDPDYVTDNQPVLGGLKWATIHWAFTHAHSANWHPLTWLSHTLDCQIYGLNPAGHHLTNLLLHTANTAVLFLLLRSLTGALWRSACVSALFALHPMHVESVAWIAERKDVLSALFFMLTLLAYAKYGEAKVSSLMSKVAERDSGAASQESAVGNDLGGASRHSPFTYYALALLLFALGLMSKPMLVTLPFVMLLLDYWPLGRWGGAPGERKGESGEGRGKRAEAETGVEHGTWGLVWEKVPFFVLSAASSAVTFLVQRAGEAVAPLEQTPLAARMLNAVVSYFRYVCKLAWPTNLAVLYPDVRQWPVGTTVVAGLALAAVTMLVLWQRRQRPYLVVGWGWFVGMLVPVIGLVKVGSQSIADRYTYLPAIGLFIMLVWGAAELFGYASGQGRASLVEGRIVPPHPSPLPQGEGEPLPSVGPGPVRCALAAVGAGIMLTACALVTQSQVLLWQNTETLFRHALAVTTNNFVAYNSLGFYFAELGEVAEAKSCLRNSLAVTPNCYQAWSKLATLLIDEGRYEEAIADCQIAVRINPRKAAAAHSTQGLALMKLGNTNEALAQYSEALRLDPEFAEAHYNLANALAHQGQYEQARQHYQASLRSAPRSADAHNNLAYMLVRQGKLEEAVAEFRTAVALRPGLWHARYGLALSLGRQGKTKNAAEQLQEVLRTKPDFPDALNRLAWIRATDPDPEVRNGTEAVALAGRGCQITQYKEAGMLGTLAAAYAEAGRFADAVSAAERAQNLAQTQGQNELAKRNQRLLELFRSGQPCRQLPGQAAPF